MVKNFPGIFLLLLFFFPGYAQLNNQVFFDHFPVDSANEGKIYLEIANLNYFKNNEYFSQINPGYTLFGYRINPRLTYYPHKHLRVDGGVFLRKDLGSDKIEVLPTFTLKYSKKSFSLLFGNIESSLNHLLTEPLYDFEKVIKKPLEGGIQFLFNKPSYFMDIWVDWQRMIYPGSKYKERIWGGISTSFTIVDHEAFKINLPFQFTAFHIGGQIDNSSEPTITQMNIAPGLGIELKTENSSFIKSIRADNWFIYQKNNSLISYINYPYAYGTYNNLTLRSKFLDLMISYWYAYHFTSLQGGALYQSFSSFYLNPDYNLPIRQLLIVRLLKDISLIPDCYLSLRLEPYFDMMDKKLEYSYGFYINYRPSVFLTKIKLRNDD